MHRLKRAAIYPLILSLATLGAPVPSQAALVTTQEAAASAPIPGPKERLEALVGRADVRKELEKFGVDPADAKARVAALTDDEARALTAKIDEAPAGGDVIGALLIVFVVLLITDILGFTKVFSFTRPIK